MDSRLRRTLADDAGSTPVEFLLVGIVLTFLTLGVLQFGFALYVRNVVHDAAVEGAYVAALADTTPAAGVDRTREIVARAVGAQYTTDIAVRETTTVGGPTIELSVRATLPLVGLFGVPGTLEVTAHAPAESFD
ncbi:pilus assembly protein [Microbacterium aoyamense]|uniref:Pilus assembly protein n=1 Tax=Microbacterium aoyamense TaxID=344166 RepID=A0ABP5BAB5_9MICO|nr:TadE family protein [Microbacterium aoyamense]